METKDFASLHCQISYDLYRPTHLPTWATGSEYFTLPSVRILNEIGFANSLFHSHVF